MNSFPLSGVKSNPPVVEAGSTGESHNSPVSGLTYPLNYYLGTYTSAAIVAGAKLTVWVNRGGSVTAEAKWPIGHSIAGTMPTPSEALAQVEVAIRRETEGE